MGNRVQKSRIEELESRFGGEAPPAEEAETGGVDYTDPAVQERVLNPRTIPFTLQFEDGRPAKDIVIRTAFTQDMVGRRGALDKLNALAQLIIAELSAFTPGGGLPTQAWVDQHPAYLGVAACQPLVCERTRDLIAVLSDTPREEIEDGIDSTNLAQFTVALVTIYNAYTKNSSRGKTVPVSA